MAHASSPPVTRDPLAEARDRFLAADPVAQGTSGVRHFFTDESGVIRYSMRGGADVNSETLM